MIDHLTKLLIDGIPDVKDVTWVDLGLGQYVAQLKFAWWSWLVFSPVRKKWLDKAHEIIDANKDEGTDVLVEVW